MMKTMNGWLFMGAFASCLLCVRTDIRFNLENHQYSSISDDGEPDFSEDTPERIGPHNHKILRTKRIIDGDILKRLRFEMEVGVTIKSVEVRGVKPSTAMYTVILKPTKGKLIEETVSGLPSYKKPYDIECSYMEITAEDMIYKMTIVITYAYLPYDVADYLVIEGLYKPFEATTTITTPSTTTTETDFPDVSSTVLADTTMVTSTDSTTNPADSTTNPADSTTNPADSTTNPADSTTNPADSTTNPADSTTNPADSTTNPADSTTNPADSTTNPADSTTNPADSTTNPADSTTNPAATNRIQVTNPSVTTAIEETTPYASSTVLTDTTIITSAATTTKPVDTTTKPSAMTTTPADTTNRQGPTCTRLCSCGYIIWGDTTLKDLDPAILPEVLRMISELKTRLAVNKTTLSAWKATKTSAPDKRTSATGIGATGIVIIVGAMLVVIMADVTSFLSSKGNGKILPSQKVR